MQRCWFFTGTLCLWKFFSSLLFFLLLECMFAYFLHVHVCCNKLIHSGTSLLYLACHVINWWQSMLVRDRTCSQGGVGGIFHRFSHTLISFLQPIQILGRWTEAQCVCRSTQLGTKTMVGMWFPAPHLRMLPTTPQKVGQYFSTEHQTHYISLPSIFTQI